MKKQAIYLLLATYVLCMYETLAQKNVSDSIPSELTRLFMSDEVLGLRLSYSNRELDKNTNDSTYLDTDLSFLSEDGNWKVLKSQIRARGKFRRKNCYFPPAKFKIKKAIAKGTLFQGNKKLKLVLPCLQQKSANDNVVKEFLAYKLFELVSPYHFNTRLVEIEFSENRGKKTKEHLVKGFLIEDDEKIAKRYNGNMLKRFVHPLQQETKTSVINAFFQFMIGNTDYSTAYRHNQKLLFVDKKTICIPYDFDMSGLVDASYSVVSQVQGEVLRIENVTQRMYRGFKRDNATYYEVRSEFLSKKDQMYAEVDALKPYFENQQTFSTARSFIGSFFEIMENDSKFKKTIVDVARTK